MDILTVCYILNFTLMIVMAIGLGVLFTRKFRLGWRLYGIGAATFILSQVGHIPFNAFVLNAIIPPLDGMAGLLLSSAVLGLSAGLWEEGARYIVYRWWAKDARSWRSALLFGAGHGGVEALLIAALAFWGFLNFYTVRGMDLSTLAQGDQLAALQAAYDQFWSANWYDALLGAVERAFALTLHLSCSVLVAQVFIRKQLRWLWAAVLLHSGMDFAAVLVFRTTQNVYWTEAAVGGIALVGLGIILALREPAPPLVAESSSMTEPPEAIVIQPVEETPENLDQSKFN